MPCWSILLKVWGHDPSDTTCVVRDPGDYNVVYGMSVYGLSKHSFRRFCMNWWSYITRFSSFLNLETQITRRAKLRIVTAFYSLVYMTWQKRIGGRSLSKCCTSHYSFSPMVNVLQLTQLAKKMYVPARGRLIQHWLIPNMLTAALLSCLIF